MHIFIAILVIVLLAVIVVGLVLQHRLYSRLGIAHPNALDTLAESSAGIMAFQRYLWRRHYVGLHDATFTRLADFLRRYWTACFLYFLLVVTALLLAVLV
jgi:hypothetical protein